MTNRKYAGEIKIGNESNNDGVLKYTNDKGVTVVRDGVEETVNRRVMTETEFFALAEERKARRGGSGFDEWGRFYNWQMTEINKGMFVCTGTGYDRKRLYLGMNISETGVKTPEPVVCVNGVKIHLRPPIADRVNIHFLNTIKFPEAPTDEKARQDLVGLEVWHEKISDKDFYYPGGDVSTSYSHCPDAGVNTVAPTFSGYDTYSLLGDWQNAGDNVVNGLVWSSLTDEQRQKIAANPIHNIYINEDGEYIQVRYRWRVIKGKTNHGAEWKNLLSTHEYNKYLEYDDHTYVKPKGSLPTIPKDLDDHVIWRRGFYITQNLLLPPENTDLGIFVAVDEHPWLDKTIGYKGHCYFLPVAMVSRNRNQGAFHPLYNSGGCKKFADDKDWNETSESITSTADCFDSNKILADSGTYSSGKSGRPDGMYYDDISPYDVKDLRMSTEKINVTQALCNKVLCDLARKSVRGYEGQFYIRHLNPINATLDNIGLNGYYRENMTELTFSGELILNNDPSAGSWVSLPIKSKIFIKDDDGLYREVVLIDNNANNNNITHVKIHPRYGDICNKFTIGNQYSAIVCEQNDCIYNNQIPQCHVIGNPDTNNFQNLIQEGHIGLINLIDNTNFTNNIPDGSKTSFRIMRKISGNIYKVYKNNVVMTSGYSFNETENQIIFDTAPAADDVITIFVRSDCGYVKSGSVNTNVVNKVCSDAYVTNSHNLNGGALIASEIFSKIINTAYVPSQQRIKMKELNLTSSKFNEMWQYPNIMNGDISLGKVGDGFKFLVYFTNKYGYLYARLLVKEIRTDGNSWGDNLKFEVPDRDLRLMKDNNNKLIIFGHAEFILPIGFANEE